jgi:hypothetical protein
VIFVGIDDTDIIDTPGTNQLARAILRRLGDYAAGAVICRHQLFFDPRVPYTSKNGSASIQLPEAGSIGLERLIDTVREVMRGWFVAGSDPGLCVATQVPAVVTEFGLRCKGEVVTQEEARAVARSAGCHLEGLGGTEQGIIGALAAVGLVAGGADGRVVQLASWPYPDDFSGPHSVAEIRARGIDEVRQAASDAPVQEGLVEIVKRLRPSWRDGRVVLYVAPAATPEAAAPWTALKLP